MKFDIEKHSQFKDTVLEYYAKHGISKIPLLCTASGISLVAAYTWLSEVEPDNEYFKNKIKSLMEFYDYEA